MNKNILTIIIDKPVEEVFEFTTNPQNTHKWVPSISVEVADEYPPKINTKYKNRGGNTDWDVYKVVDFRPNELFILADTNDNYYVKYTYRKLTYNKTEMEYCEWMNSGELANPFTMSILGNLKKVMEQ